MPVQTWTPGQVLTASEMTTVTNMLPYPLATNSSVNPCVAGTFYRCTSASAMTMTLPAPTTGVVIGFIVDNDTPTGVTITRGGTSEFFLGAGLPRPASATSILISAKDACVVIEGDGTNWHIITASASGANGYVSAGGMPLFGTYTGQPILTQFGGITATSSGVGLVTGTFPTAFPNGVLGVVPLPSGTNPSYFTSVGSASLTTVALYCWKAFHGVTTGPPPVPQPIDLVLSTSVSISYIAYGF